MLTGIILHSCDLNGSAREINLALLWRKKIHAEFTMQVNFSLSNLKII